jgi:hypothetical protein
MAEPADHGPAPPVPGRGARQHLEACPAAQQPLVRALLEWQAASVPRRAAPAPAAPGPSAAALGDALRLDRTALDWQAWPHDVPVRDEQGEPVHLLGHAALWPALGAGPEWLMLHLSVHRSGRWYAPRVALLPEHQDQRGSWRTGVGLAGAESLALERAGVTLAALREAATEPQTALWLHRREGLGAIVALALDLGWAGP